ncbi:hypothetical protein N657DRAFT_643485 [Parathielavia appendiculata]|uniref:Uncharacterized protein n=1 Tax=Parathielavia appendiculata TaxID=2587402 RepID=A0AAN6U2H4_9PEZI|nr:hypothetical protein N657DRAFT_643485 [Parathielavia appendiculata]
MIIMMMGAAALESPKHHLETHPHWDGRPIASHRGFQRVLSQGQRKYEHWHWPLAGQTNALHGYDTKNSVPSARKIPPLPLSPPVTMIPSICTAQPHRMHLCRQNDLPEGLGCLHITSRLRLAVLAASMASQTLLS